MKENKKKYRKTVNEIIEEARTRLSGISEKFYSNYGLKDPITNSKYSSSRNLKQIKTSRYSERRRDLKNIGTRSLTSRNLKELANTSSGFRKRGKSRLNFEGILKKRGGANDKKNFSFAHQNSKKKIKNKFFDHEKFMSETTEKFTKKKNLVETKVDHFQKNFGFNSKSRKRTKEGGKNVTLSSLAFKSTLQSKMTKAKVDSIKDLKQMKKAKRQTKFIRKIDSLKDRIEFSGSRVKKLRKKMSRTEKNFQLLESRLRRSNSTQSKIKVLSTHMQNIGSQDSTVSIFNTKLAKLKRFNSTIIKPKDFMKGESLNLKDDHLYEEVNFDKVPANFDKEERNFLRTFNYPSFDHLNFNAVKIKKRYHSRFGQEDVPVEENQKFDYSKILLKKFARVNKKKLMDRISHNIVLQRKYRKIQDTLHQIEKETNVPLNRLSMLAEKKTPQYLIN